MVKNAEFFFFAPDVWNDCAVRIKRKKKIDSESGRKLASCVFVADNGQIKKKFYF